MNTQKDATQYALISKAQKGDKNAKEQLTAENTGLVYSIARKFYDRGYDKEDINQIGFIGLLKAIDKFDPSYNVCFSTYAVPLIMGEIKRFLRDDGLIKVSRSHKQLAAEAARVTEEIQKKEGRIPGVMEIAKVLHAPPEEIAEAQSATRPIESFSAVRKDSGKTLADFLPDKENESDWLDSLDLKKVVAALPPREQSIVIMRYFFEKTQSDIAKKLGISQVQVSRIERKILTSFRKQLTQEQ